MGQPFLLPLRQKYTQGYISPAYPCKGRTGNSHGPKRHSMLYFLNRMLKKRGK